MKQEELAELKRELDEKTVELNEIRGVEIEMRNKLEENQKIFADNQKRLRYWNDKLSKLSVQSVRLVSNKHFLDPSLLTKSPAI